MEISTKDFIALVDEKRHAELITILEREDQFKELLYEKRHGELLEALKNDSVLYGEFLETIKSISIPSTEFDDLLHEKRHTELIESINSLKSTISTNSKLPYIELLEVLNSIKVDQDSTVNIEILETLKAISNKEYDNDNLVEQNILDAVNMLKFPDTDSTLDLIQHNEILHVLNLILSTNQENEVLKLLEEKRHNELIDVLSDMSVKLETSNITDSMELLIKTTSDSNTVPESIKALTKALSSKIDSLKDVYNNKLDKWKFNVFRDTNGYINIVTANGTNSKNDVNI